MTRLAVVFVFSVWAGVGARPSPSQRAPSGPAVLVTRSADDVARDGLSHYLTLAAESTTRDQAIAELRRGLQRMDAGDARGAIQAFERAAEVLPGIADWARILGARAAAYDADITTVDRLLAETEPVLAREWGWRARLLALEDAGDLEGAIAAARVALDSLEDGTLRAEAAIRIAELESRRGNGSAARGMYRRAIEIAPGSSHAIDAARTLSSRSDLRPEDHLAIGRTYLRHGNRDRGIDGIDRYFRTGSPSSAEKAALRLDIARSFFNAGSYAEAERRVSQITGVKEAPEVASQAMLLLGRAQYRRDRVTAARATLLKLPDTYPGTPAAAEALYIVADLDHDAGAHSRARGLYRRAMTEAPSSDAAGEAAMRLGGLDFLDGRHSDAAAIFEEYREHHPDGRRFQQATHWAGRAYAAAGQQERATALFQEAAGMDPASFYGIRAADHLEDGAWKQLLTPSPVTDPKNALETSGAFMRLDILSELELEREHAYEMARLRRYFAGRPGAFYALAEGFHGRGETYTGISLGRELQRAEGTWNERLLRIIYPFPYRESIVQFARERDIDPYLVAGLIRQESMFNPTARSHAGAIGLMQVMPATGRGLARRVGTQFAVNKLREPTYNIRLGTLFMADLLGRYDGRLSYVLAAYNAGPSRVARWRNMPEAKDPDLFAERIPFAETRDYVKIVQQNARIYEALYSQ